MTLLERGRLHPMGFLGLSIIEMFSIQVSPRDCYLVLEMGSLLVSWHLTALVGINCGSWAIIYVR